MVIRFAPWMITRIKKTKSGIFQNQPRNNLRFIYFYCRARDATAVEGNEWIFFLFYVSLSLCAYSKTSYVLNFDLECVWNVGIEVDKELEMGWYLSSLREIGLLIRSEGNFHCWDCVVRWSFFNCFFQYAPVENKNRNEEKNYLHTFF